MSTSRACLRPILSSSSSTCISQRLIPQSSLLTHTNHLRHQNSPHEYQQRRHITRPRQAIRDPEPEISPIENMSPPPGFRRNKITRPFVPVGTRERKPFKVNESLEMLNTMFNTLLGPGGDKALPDDIKWQCVTHKSFDHGMQPFNAKLTFFGRRIIYLHTTLSMIHKPTSPTSSLPSAAADPNTTAPDLTNTTSKPSIIPEPDQTTAPVDSPPPIKTKLASSSIPESPLAKATFNTSSIPESSLKTITKRHPVNNISYSTVTDVVSSANLFAIARVCKLVPCLRWKPMDGRDLKISGVEKVAEDAIYAIVGAIALYRGGEAARRVVEERILVGVNALRESE